MCIVESDGGGVAPDPHEAVKSVPLHSRVL